MSKPRILVVAPRMDRGGAEIHLTRILPRLRAAGLDVSLFAIRRGGALEPTLQASGVPVLGVTVGGGRALRDIRVAGALRAELKRRRPDILHFFLTEPYLVGSLAAAGLRGIKRVMSRRSLSTYRDKYPLAGLAEQLLHRSTVALVGNSSAVVRELVEECGAPRKVGLIHNGIELPPAPSREQRIRLRRQLQLPEQAFVAVVVANLIPYKGHADLLAAFALLRQRLSSDWRLVFAGRDQGHGAALRAQAAAEGIADRIVWLGELAEVHDVLASADIGILPSHEEGFSNSLIEKMAYRLAVVATRVGGNTDAIEDGESGLLVPARDPAALAEGVLRLHDDPGLRERLATAALMRVERRFSIEACTQRYMNLYSGLLHGNGPVSEIIDPPAAPSNEAYRIASAVAC